MKKFVSENWYKLMIGSSVLMASFGFMVHSVSTAMADNNNQKLNVNSNYKLVPTNADGSINVKLSDEQVGKIIPKNEDGSINVKLSDEQVGKIIPKNEDGSINVRTAPNAAMDINLRYIMGNNVGYCVLSGERKEVALGVCQ